MRRILWALALLIGFALPANATSVTIDSTNCNSSNGCYGLTWTLDVVAGSFSFNGTTYGYQALLKVTDDPLVTGTPSILISAVDFKASSSVLSPAVLFTVPSSTALTSWVTVTNGLNSGGCTGSGAGFVCSQASVSPSLPATFVASSTPQTWGWYFNTNDPIFAGLDGAHIGAKLTDLSNPGKLLSASYSIPESASFTMLGIGLALSLGFRRRRHV